MAMAEVPAAGWEFLHGGVISHALACSRLALACSGLPWHARACLGMLGLALACSGLPWHARACLGILRACLGLRF